MDRLNALFSADEVRGIRLLIVEGKIKVDTFHLFSDADLVTTLRDELASQQGKAISTHLLFSNTSLHHPPSFDVVPISLIFLQRAIWCHGVR